jgi:signal peptidase II
MIYVGIIAIIFASEYGIKQWIEKNKTFDSKDLILQGKVILRKHHNRGTAGQFLEKRQGIIAVVALVFTIIMTLIFAITLTKHGSSGLKTGLAFLLGGAYSNTYDRIRRTYVVDYITFKSKGKFGKLVFNISDFCILLGAVMICIFQK